MFYFGFNLPENLKIFFDNLCLHHIYLDLFSFVTLAFTWWYCTWSSNETEYVVHTIQPRPVESHEMAVLTNNRNNNTEDDNPVHEFHDDSSMSSGGCLTQKVLVEELKSKLTEDELEEERKVGRKQLQKIFQLLRQEEEKFKLSPIQILEDQLPMYVY